MKYIPYVRESTLFLVLMLKYAKSDSQRPKFREDYRYEKAFNAFYKLHSVAVEWHQARIRCEAEGAELIVPDTLDEADSLPLIVSAILTKYNGAYVGMHDLYAERFFVTVDGSSMQDSILDLLWELKQPIHSGGRCVAMRRNGHLFVNPCSDPLPFVCKVKANDVKYYKECDTYDPRWKLGPNDTCYITHEERQTWHEAYSSCLAAGGYLAILDTRAEAEYMRDLFKHVDQHKTPGDFAFLGFSDLFQRYHYRTVHGDPIAEDYVDWDFQCPEGDVKHDMRCGGFRRSGLLATGDCHQSSMFFCEKPAKSTKNLRNVEEQTPEKASVRRRHKHRIISSDRNDDIFQIK